MKYFWTIILFLPFISCGPFVAAKRDKYIKSKGYNPQKDILIVKPFEYYSKSNGYVPIFRQIDCLNKKNIKISIVGFEELDTISFERLFKKMSLSLDDSTVKLKHAELLFLRNRITHYKYFDRVNADSCSCDFSYENLKNNWRKKGKRDALLLWNLSVIKDNTVYCIPNRGYYLR